MAMPAAPIRAATPDDREDVLRAVSERPAFACPGRSWDAPALRHGLYLQMAAQYERLLAHPDVDLLLAHQDGALRSWAIIQHGCEEAVSGDRMTLIRTPSRLLDAGLVAEAAERAQRRGSVRLGVDLAPNADDEAAVCAAVGMVAEFQRIVLPLPRLHRGSPGGDVSPLPKKMRVRPAELSDRLFLLTLSTRCVPFMFHERRRHQLERMRARMFDVYASLDVADDDALCAWIALTASDRPAGAVLVRPQAETAFDHDWEAYIYDLSVSPESWGRWYGMALVVTAAHEMARRRVGYLTGDVSTENARVQALARRLGFHVESRRWFLDLQKMGTDDIIFFHKQGGA